MTQDEIIEMAIQGHASTRDAIRWAMNQEREACATRCEELEKAWVNAGLWKVTHEYKECSVAIRARGEA